MDKRQNKDINIAIVGLDYDFVLEVSKILASQLGLYFLDTIGLYEFDISPNTLEEVLINYGEPYFREKQKSTVKYVSSFNNTVMSFESGVVLDPENLDCIDKYGLIVYIHQDEKSLVNEFIRCEYKSQTLDKFFHISKQDIAKRDAILQQRSEIIVDATNYETIRCAGDIIKGIKKYYGVNF